jgi:sulfide:quinone oxidoreductase
VRKFAVLLIQIRIFAENFDGTPVATVGINGTLPKETTMARILILGGGFGGLVVAEELAAASGPGDSITLVSSSRTFTFYPALVQMAFGECSAGDIQFDLQMRLKELGVHYIEGEMTRIIPSRQAVEIAGKDFRGEISYDYLVFAIGRRLATERVNGFFKYAHHLLGVHAALKFGDAVRDFREGEIIVGLCPGSRLPVPVCETAFALARKFESEIKDERVHIKAIFPDSLDTAFGGARIHEQLEKAFINHRISVLYDVPISEITDDTVYSSLGHEIRHDLLMLVPPFRGHATISNHGITDEDDFIKVDDKMRVAGMENAYAVGDNVAFSGPKFAHMAVRQAKVAAANLISEINGKEPHECYYHEIAAIIDSGGADSLYLHYGIWNEELIRTGSGTFWSFAKNMHSTLWQVQHS